MPVPEWVKATIDSWLASAKIAHGRLFRCVCRAGKTWGKGMTERVVWHVVKDCAKQAGIEKLAPIEVLSWLGFIFWLIYIGLVHLIRRRVAHQ